MLTSEPTRANTKTLILKYRLYFNEVIKSTLVSRALSIDSSFQKWNIKEETKIEWSMGGGEIVKIEVDNYNMI